MRANLPSPSLFIGKAIPGRPDLAVVELVASGNDGHLFRGHSTALARDFACKVIPRSNLRHGPDGQPVWQQEVHKADALRSSTVVKFLDMLPWHVPADDIDCEVLVSEYVEGPNLRKFIKASPSEVTVAFIVQWLETMLNLLNEMKLRSIKHGDIHSGNILVEDRSAYDLQGPRFVFRVTDFGVAEASSDPRFKDDYLQLADVLEQLLQQVDYASLNAREKYVFDVLRQHFLARHLPEEDVTRDPLARQPDSLFTRLQSLNSEFDKVAAQDDATLLTPFDFLSCEQIGDAPALLRALYSDRFLGLPEIEGRNNVVVTGPRGCGKTTVFRSLSLDHRLRVEDAVPSDITYIGIYYRCDDLYFAFPRYTLPTNAAAIDIPIHFVTCTLLGKFVESLEVWARKYFAADFTRLESNAAKELWTSIGLTPPSVPGNYTLKAIAARLQKERARAAEWHRFANDPKRSVGNCFGPDVLAKACDVIATQFPFVHERPIYFFVDDYSAPKVTRALQQSLNRLLLQRSSRCFVKLSTESPVSFAKSDIDGKIYVENREFMLYNLGLVFLHAPVSAKLAFIEDVFRRRLAKTAPEFPAKELEDLVGSNSAQNNNEVARGIRAGAKPSLFGKEVIPSYSPPPREIIRPIA